MKHLVLLEILFIYDIYAKVHTETLLEQHIFSDYNKIVLPRTNSSKPIKVSLHSYLGDLSYLREAENVLETNMYFHVEWTDDFLKWNLSKYNVKELAVDYQKLWLPDIFIINGLGDSRYLPVQNTLVHVSYNGFVSWWPGGNIKTKCKLYVSKYPFDSQLCKLILEPWKLSVEQQTFEIAQIAMDDLPTPFEENANWEVTDIKQVTHMFAFYGYYNMAHYELRIYLKRRVLYHVFNIVFPVLLMSIISMCSYLIPPSSGEKMSVCVSIFLSFAVYVTIINNELPRTASGVCYFGLYLFTQLAISGCTIVLSALVLHIYHKEGKCQVPGPCNSGKESKNRVTDCVGIEGTPVKETVRQNDNKAFAIKLDYLFFKLCFILNLMSFVVYLILSNS
ncbi:hypothetical protein FSP39_019111 [Pinctada imbricata]|uniref:Uncharacterized protein n=1 Tax=Pinctada imbricata TaxID=66713 RepID=A0AA88XKW0_PINIB|nr:hypothetical protein FSP39_019111 [Pinctada imbricata]